MIAACLFVGLLTAALAVPPVNPDGRVTGSEAFGMFRTSDLGPVAQETLIIFNDIEADVGGNIEANNLFRAPLDGTYIFSYTLHGTDAEVEVRRRRSGVVDVMNEASIASGGQKSTGGTILLDLLDQDEIYMMLMPGSGVLHASINREISFSGFLLYQRILTNDARVTGTEAFSMFRTTDLGPVAQETIIGFGDIEANVGGNIEANNLFRAPLDGTYIFSYTLHGTDEEVEVRRRRSGVVDVMNKASIGSGLVKSTGGTILLDLLDQDEIYLMLMPGGDGLYGSIKRENSFSGFLLYQRILANMGEIGTTGTASFSMFRASPLGPVAQDTLITYDIIESNVGNVIDASSTFVAPLDGTYIFSYTIYGNNVEVQLTRDRSSVTEVMNAVVAGDGNYIEEQVSTGSTVLLDLFVGDRVFLVLLGGGSEQTLTGTPNREVSFSGFLLYQRL